MNKRKILISCAFAIAVLMVVTVFLTATTYFQLAVAILFYSLVVLFFFVAFPRGVRMAYPNGRATAVWQPAQSARGTSAAKAENVGIIDIDRRAFLKLIGGAGLALFLFSIFNKKVENLFFKSLPSPSEKSLEIATTGIIDPTQTLPMYGYTITEIDDNIVAFYGFTNRNGAWFIMREDTNKGSFRYVRGNYKFPNNWANRVNLSYDYYNNVFKP